MSEVQRYTFGYVHIRDENGGDYELQMIPAKYGEAVKYTDHAKRVQKLEKALEQHQALMELACADIIFFHSHDSGPFINPEPYESPVKVAFSVLVNDLFYPAADAEGFDISKAIQLRDVFRKDGYAGVVRWVQRKRGNLPLRPKAEARISATESARAALKEPHD